MDNRNRDNKQMALNKSIFEEFQEDTKKFFEEGQPGPEIPRRENGEVDPAIEQQAIQIWLKNNTTKLQVEKVYKHREAIYKKLISAATRRDEKETMSMATRLVEIEETLKILTQYGKSS